MECWIREYSNIIFIKDQLIWYGVIEFVRHNLITSIARREVIDMVTRLLIPGQELQRAYTQSM